MPYNAANSTAFMSSVIKGKVKDDVLSVLLKCTWPGDSMECHYGVLRNCCTHPTSLLCIV